MKIKAPSKQQTLQFIKDNLLWILGCSIYSISLNCFAVPNNIAQSGISGLAIVVNYLLKDFSLGTINFVLNLPLLILAFIFIGKAFVGKTLWVVALLSAALDIWGKILPVYKGEDKLLVALISGLLSGIGLALVIMTGTTTGGTDIIGRLVHKRWQHIPIGRVIMISDAVVVITAAVVFRNIESALYAVIVIFVSSTVIDKINYGMGNGKMLMIITEKGDEISSEITTRTTRGVTKVPVEGAYSGENKQMLVCVVRDHEVQKMNKIIKSVDPQTFIIISEANEILGKGFRKPL